MNNSGWICLHRKIEYWEWYQDINTFRLFVHLLIKANHKDNKWRGIEILRGQTLTSLQTLSQETQLTIQQTRTSLFNLKSTHEITIKTTNKYSIITVCNYDNYQDRKIQINTQDGTQNDIQKTNEQQTNNTPDNNKQQINNYNNENNENNKTPLKSGGGGEIEFYKNIFKEFYEIYPNKREPETEFNFFVKNIKDWMDVLQLLKPAFIKEKEYKNSKNLTKYKKLQNWITEREWESSFQATVNNPDLSSMDYNRKGF